ncbi:SDR family oxidoreductase [Polynucleobacter sp. MWH-Braz-FAM2G]|uniref:dTDP-4-dehydrorhamnose reductase family protein n=1 Tax=Polynucleobacter sp. MWH-Braz-FAM2G TaxID=1855883 RepID=UPI001BFEA567|nr:SDR family oxidoreductase [Polynucleobacter sp. MWH-Braz-FAM2G]QWD91105.1 SDR family oxidoreductase [Polynucleobacter sp. MWH-Braz-FAM2G]
MNVLILGVTGLIGSTLARYLAQDKQMQVFGSTRKSEFNAGLVGLENDHIYKNINIEDIDSLVAMLEKSMPSIVINCAGITKHLMESNNPIAVLPINSIFPHRLGKLCGLMGIRLIQISSDCVFSGATGSYTEESIADALDLYGRSKAFGEIANQCNCITLRTSTIGHEIETRHGLLEWFLHQKSICSGFGKAIFSGLTSFELAKVIKNFVIPNQAIYGLYNIAAEPISKYDLLCLIANVYHKDVMIVKNDEFVIDRSLIPEKFFKSTGYKAPSWINMISDMYNARPNV